MLCMILHLELMNPNQSVFIYLFFQRMFREVNPKGVTRVWQAAMKVQ